MQFSDFNLSKCADGLLPVVVQDAVSLKVLMLGYMNEEAFNMTQATKHVTFFSRTRQTLWTKGETSGHFLNVVEMYGDCDADTLLVMANPVGPTCHRGTTSCFDTPEDEGFIRRLSAIVRQRHEEMPEGSYTQNSSSRASRKSRRKWAKKRWRALWKPLTETEAALSTKRLTLCTTISSCSNKWAARWKTLSANWH